MSKTLYGVLAWLALMPVQALGASQWEFENVSRVVAMSDIHGAYAPMVRTLQNAQILDEATSWAGGSAHLVIIGDILDRGPDSRAAMDLLMRLEGEASAAGGAVHVLIGNHEAMNLTGDLRYVSREEYAAFADDESGEDRAMWFRKFEAGRNLPDGESAEAVFKRRFPPGYFAHRRAFAADGQYGKWLLEQPVIVVINRTAFVHGGLSPKIAELGLEGVNDSLRAELIKSVQHFETLEQAGVVLPTDSARERSKLIGGYKRSQHSTAAEITAVAELVKLDQSDLNAADGPLWYRGNVYCPDLIEMDRLQAALDAINADRVVIGHTPTPDREVMQRLDGRVLEVDTGMLNSYYGGRGHVLELVGEAVRVISEQSAESLSPELHPRRVGARPDGELSATELESLLSRGELGELREDEYGQSIVSVSNGEHKVQALFSARAAKGVYPDVAAYRLDLQLGLGMVPVAVIREVQGNDGSLQFLPDQPVNEMQRAKSGQGGGAYCPLSEQWPAMYVFDSLIYNQGRSQQRMLYSTDIWQLLLVDHEDAFAAKKGRPKHLEKVPLNLTPAWRGALAALDEATLDATLGDVLDKKRRKALLARRDELMR
jgi:hypothetical protein